MIGLLQVTCFRSLNVNFQRGAGGAKAGNRAGSGRQSLNWLFWPLL